MSGETHIDWANVKRVLIHKPDHIGDLLCAAPALALIRQAAPEAKIIAGVTDRAAAFWQSLDLIDDVYPLAGPSWHFKSGALDYIRRARKQAFDLAVNFRNDFRDILALQCLGAKITCTYDHKNTAKFADYSLAVRQDLSETDNHLALVKTMGLAASGGHRARVGRQDAYFVKKVLPDAKKCVVFHPFAGSPAKCWPVKHVIECVNIFMEKNICVILIGSEAFAPDAKLVEGACPGLINLTGKTNPGRLYALVEAADLLLAADSGPGHIGPLVDTPVVSIMSGTNEARRWAPKGARVIRAGAPCAPCAKRICDAPGHPCMTGNAPQTVAETVFEVMGL